MVPAALGTDTAGSVRIPAAMSGISSIKPTHGRVPIAGIVPLAATLDHAGPMARSLADCSALLAAMADGGAEATPLMPPPAPLGPMPLDAVARAAAARRADDRGARRPAAASRSTPTSPTGLEDAARRAASASARASSGPSGPQDASLASGRSWRASTSGRITSSSTAARTTTARSCGRSPPRVRDAGPAAAYARRPAGPRRARRGSGSAGWRRAGIDLLLEATIPGPAPQRTLGYAAGAAQPRPAHPAHVRLERDRLPRRGAARRPRRAQRPAGRRLAHRPARAPRRGRAGRHRPAGARARAARRPLRDAVGSSVSIRRCTAATARKASLR